MSTCQTEGWEGHAETREDQDRNTREYVMAEDWRQ